MKKSSPALLNLSCALNRCHLSQPARIAQEDNQTMPEQIFPLLTRIFCQTFIKGFSKANQNETA